MVSLYSIVALALAPAAVAAQEASSAPVEAASQAPVFKLTLGWYRYSDDTDGVDLNLRHSSSFGNVWLGYYEDHGQQVSQWRGGWDRSFGTDVRIAPSLQLASGGFVGGSVQAEVGSPWFAAAGLGRTNLRPYVNLNFDPNDSWLVVLGHRDEGGQVVMLQMIRDNRENPDQRHFHLNYRQPLEAGRRLTLDALYKIGNVEGSRIRRWGWTATYDWPRFFARLARDPDTNFTPVDAWRLSVGTRF